MKGRKKNAGEPDPEEGTGISCPEYFRFCMEWKFLAVRIRPSLLMRTASSDYSKTGVSAIMGVDTYHGVVYFYPNTINSFDYFVFVVYLDENMSFAALLLFSMRQQRGPPILVGQHF